MAKKEIEVSLETILMNCRNALRGVGTTEKNRDAVIGLVFLKFAYDKFEHQRSVLHNEYKDLPQILDDPSFYLKDNVFYLPVKARWDYISSNASSEDVAILIDEAMSLIEKENESLKGALPQGLFVNLGASTGQIKSLIDEVSKIDQESFQEEDLIGRVYEYFLASYAAMGAKDVGEFYTPVSVVKLIAEMIEPYDGYVYDPCCGSGGMFVQSLKFIDAHNGNRKMVSIMGQESKPETWQLCKMNLAIRGISCNLGDRNESTFKEDLHKGKLANYIMANPPFNLKNWIDGVELSKDPRFKNYPYPSEKNANYAWILHMLSKLDRNNGVAGFLLANGALNDSNSGEYQIRKMILEEDRVEAIIVLPRDMFYTTDISVTLWILNMNKQGGEKLGRKLRDRSGEVLFMDLRSWDDYQEKPKGSSSNKTKTALSDLQIDRAANIYHNWQSLNTEEYKDIPELCRSVNIQEIAHQDYNLAPSKYIEFINHDLEIDYEVEMKRIQSKMKNILKVEKESQKKLEEAFRGIGYEIN